MEVTERGLNGEAEKIGRGLAVWEDGMNGSSQSVGGEGSEVHVRWRIESRTLIKEGQDVSKEE